MLIVHPIANLLEDREFPLFEGSLEHVRSYTYVADVIEGMIAAMNAFAVTGENPIVVASLTTLCARKLFTLDTDSWMA